jgi:tetratricopeptide (TPR) repeat protein
MEGGALVPGAGSFPDPKSGMRVIMECERAWDIKDEKGLPAAIEHIESVVREDPNFYASQRLLATLLMDAKEYGKAIKPLEKCLELHPDIPFPFVHMARARLRTGQTEKAIEMYDKAIKACPDLFAAHLELGRLFLFRNQPALAVNHLLKAFVLNPTDQSSAEEMAMAMSQAGRAEEAISNLRERLHSDPKSLAVRNALCGLLIEQNKCEEVIPLMREGLKQNPDSAPMANNLAYAIVKCKRPGDSMIEAAVMMERVCQKTNYQSPEYLRTLGLVYADLLRMDEAINVSEKALKLAEESKQADLCSDLRRFIAAFRELKARGVSSMNAIAGSGVAKPPASQPAKEPH